MHIEIIEPASIELDDAIEYYNQQVSGLGRRFLLEFLDTIKIISNFPYSWAQNTASTRKATLRKFPFSIIYTVFENRIYILAVAHQHRKPEYWIDRLLNL